MNTFPLICLLLTIPPAFASLPAPVHLKVKSLNFHNVLHWEPGPGSPPGTQFQIFKGVDGKKQKRIRKLINSTSDELQLDIEGKYQLAVKAYYNNTHSRLSKSITFEPLFDTVIGPLLLSVAGCGTCIKGDISLPDERMQRSFDPSFRVLWRKGNDKETQELKIRERNFTLGNLEKDVEYCVQVHIEIRVNKNTLPSGWNCTFTSIPQPKKGMLVLVLVTTVLIFFLVVLSTGIFCLYYTGFLCKLKEMPAGLMVSLWPDYVLTPSTIDLNQIFIIPQTVKPRNCPTKSPSSTGEADSEDEDGDVEGAVNLYMDRNAELSSDGGSHQNSAATSGNLGEGAMRDCVGFAEKQPAEVEERLAEADQYEAKAAAAQLSFTHDGDQSGLQVPVMAQEEEEMKMDFSGNVNLFSVTLASMTTCDEDEVEEDKDSGSSSTPFLRIYTLKPLSQTDSQSEQDDEISAPLTHPSEENFTTSGYEGKCAESWMDKDEEEEEEEEEFSGYLTNG